MCRPSPAFHFHATLSGMLGPTLIRDQVVQVRESREKHLLAPFGVMEAFHHEQFPLDSVMRLIQQRAGRRHLGVCEHRIPTGFLFLESALSARAVGHPSRRGDAVDKMAYALTERKHTQAFALSCAGQQGMELGAQGLADW